MSKIKILIMGVAGRDFHNFNVYFRNNSMCILTIESWLALYYFELWFLITEFYTGGVSIGCWISNLANNNFLVWQEGSNNFDGYFNY